MGRKTYKHPRRIAIVPARGGSKRLPGKNIRSFYDKPIIAYILDTARRSELFDVIHVSTESPRIIETVERLGFPVDFPRPKELADDHTPVMPVLKYVLETYKARGEKFDQVALLDATAALIDPIDLKGAAALYDKMRGERPVLSVTSYPVPVEWAYARQEDGGLVPVQPGMFAVRSQDLEMKYYDSGCFALFPTSWVLNAEAAGDETNYIGYVLQKHKVVDIDDAEDWVLAEALYKGLQVKDDG